MAIRQTRHKQRVIDLLAASKVALSADRWVRRLGAEPNRVTVYRILERLENEGIAHRVVGVNNKSYYSLCTACVTGAATSIITPIFSAWHNAALTCLELRRQLPRPPGFVVEDQQVLLIGCVLGLCGAIKNADSQ